MRSNARIYGWGRSRESIPGAAHWRWRFDEEAFSGRLWMFFLGGAGEGKRSSRARFAEKFSQNGGLQTALCMFILYVEQWRFRCNMSSGHRERGFFDPRTPWADACDVSGFNNSSTCSHSDDSGGAAAPRSTRTPWSSGYDVYAHAVYVVICYMSIICYMPVICLVQSPPQEAVVVFGYIEGPFLVSRTGCARECHAPCIEGPFLVSRTGHARERHAP